MKTKYKKTAPDFKFRAVFLGDNMKNVVKSKLLLSIFTDFVFIVALLCIVLMFFFGLKLLLYPEQSYEGELKFRTELMPKQYSESLNTGDTVFDTLTKRRVGTLREVKAIESGGEIYFMCTLDAEFIPHSKALRTRELWFYFAREDV